MVSCLELKAAFNRVNPQRRLDDSPIGPNDRYPSGPHSRDDGKQLIVFTVTLSKSKIKLIARFSEDLSKEGWR